MDSDDGDLNDDAYILLLLSDSNLPTGAFVSSSGLESYLKHGFSPLRPDSAFTFVRDSLETYARSALPFASDSHRVVSGLYSGDQHVDAVLADLTALDEHYHVMTLNHVARRASQSQGVALLSLITKGFSRPSFVTSPEPVEMQDKEARLNTLVSKLKAMVRRTDTPGHLPICWGVLTAVLGLSLGTSYPTFHFISYQQIDLQVDHNTFIYFYTQEVSYPRRFV
jgi:urease accessory protein